MNACINGQKDLWKIFKYCTFGGGNICWLWHFVWQFLCCYTCVTSKWNPMLHNWDYKWQNVSKYKIRKTRKICFFLCMISVLLFWLLFKRKMQFGYCKNFAFVIVSSSNFQPPEKSYTWPETVSSRGKSFWDVRNTT